MKEYTKVVRQGKAGTNFHQVGDIICVQEKLDGSNASFRMTQDGTLEVFSRRRQLDAENTLNGFYQYARENFEELLYPASDHNLIFFGEWLVKHKVDYGEHLNTFYLFDVFDTSLDEYLPQTKVRAWAAYLHTKMPATLFEGQFTSYEALQPLVGKSTLVDDGKGEGIIIKNQSRADEFGEQLYTKWVSDAFLEMKHGKVKNPMTATLTENWLAQFLTEARIEKHIFKLRDEEGVALEFSQFPAIMRALGNTLLADIIEEEGDSMPAEFDDTQARKLVSRMAPPVLRGLIENEVA
ncbi:RNA ligase family protein [Listeria booriae]|uniref:RNA ligase family protein n=1 Tax=Listeria booriae TaxID=1552123 RepID=A0A841ZUT0_9LIST|nr:RNA ligase family protein [Listeria booriae]MBC1564097.1 RNA ligase family protein [Listeria booriae]